MKNFNGNRGQGGYGGGGGGGRRFGGGGGGSFNRTEERPQLHRATCATCHQSCEVPFRPNGSKPVYCRDCFKRDGDSTRSPRFERKDERGFDRQEKRSFNVTCDKCGIDCDVPFRPTGSKPVYCRSCFDKGGDSSHAPRAERNFSSNAKPATDYSEQFRELNAKIDMLVDLITEAAEDFDEDEEMEDVIADDTAVAIEEIEEAVVTEEVAAETPASVEAIAEQVIKEVEDIGHLDEIFSEDK